MYDNLAPFYSLWLGVIQILCTHLRLNVRLQVDAYWQPESLCEVGYEQWVEVIVYVHLAELFGSQLIYTFSR